MWGGGGWGECQVSVCGEGVDGGRRCEVSVCGEGVDGVGG